MRPHLTAGLPLSVRPMPPRYNAAARPLSGPISAKTGKDAHAAGRDQRAEENHPLQESCLSYRQHTGTAEQSGALARAPDPHDRPGRQVALGAGDDRPPARPELHPHRGLAPAVGPLSAIRRLYRRAGESTQLSAKARAHDHPETDASAGPDPPRAHGEVEPTLARGSGRFRFSTNPALSTPLPRPSLASALDMRLARVTAPGAKEKRVCVRGRRLLRPPSSRLLASGHLIA